MADVPMAKSQINKEISARIKSNFSCWVCWCKKKKNIIDEVFCIHYACVYHTFGDHHPCTPECPAVKASANDETYVPKQVPLYPQMHSDINKDEIGAVSVYTSCGRLKNCFTMEKMWLTKTLNITRP
eukprot:15365437-Ditylum_brightwellii.AAC.2